ncbi:MAG: transketolase [Oscillospiraceae bacterium]|nr:transketolase [Oscillospiraceae bacterium]
MINDVEKLREIARNVRISALEMVHGASSGHIGGSLGIADVLAAIYFYAMDEQDKFVLSKGHCSPALYAVLAEKGIIPEEDLSGFRQANSYLQGHPSMKDVPGVDASTGSLGQGISVACGMALGLRGARDGAPYSRLPAVYCVMGDGEQQEGQVWEAAAFAAHYGLDNLCVVVDLNGLQIDGATDEVMSIGDIAAKYRAFGWNVLEINGHDFGEIMAALDAAKEHKGKPTVIIAKTIKGKGVSFMEGNYAWHGTAPNDEQFELAVKELE